MLTHGYWHDFTVSILKCKEVMKIYRDHPHCPKAIMYCSAVTFLHYTTDNDMLAEIIRELTKAKESTAITSEKVLVWAKRVEAQRA